jgi:hypothetical protein
MDQNRLTFEQGPIRPPSEASSLLLRLTRNCPWNRCLFCPVYKGETFSRRSLDQIKGDIEAIERAVIKIKKLSGLNGFGGEVNRDLFYQVRSEHPELTQVAIWLNNGGKTVFLQDGDSLLLPVSELTEVLDLLKKKFPSIDRVTTYARSRTLLRRSVDELARLRKAGLNRIHVGLESGNDNVLEIMQKGVTGQQHIEAGKRVKEAGISLSEYVILGLGGANLWREHAVDTAQVLNQIDPDFIRVRTLAVPSLSPLYSLLREGKFKPLSDDQIISEEALLIESLDRIKSRFYSDHILNLLEEINGQLPDDKKAMLGVIEAYLSLPDFERERFRLGRRTGYYRSLADLKNETLNESVEKIYKRLQREGISVDDYISRMMLKFI